jgi:tRNA threonylcarbamoyladenosine biosynthesis protein TsaB
MILLAIDTSANLCAACVWDVAAGHELGRCVRDIGKGHAEQLMAVIDEALVAARKVYADLGAVAVAVGPGSFTGIRVGVAAARGLALALGIPSAGVTTLDALAEEARQLFPTRPVLAAIDAKRGEFYVGVFGADGRAVAGPAAMTPDDTLKLLGDLHEPVLTGSAAPALAASAVRSPDVASTKPTADIAAYARSAARQGFSGEKPKPLYLREADARPQAGFVLPRREV